MSRIHQALQRTVGPSRSPGEVPEPPDQELFSPAWPAQPEDGTVPGTVVRPVGLSTAPPAAAAPAAGPAPALGRAPESPVGYLGFSSQWRERLAAGDASDPGLVEQFRRLAATLHHAQQNNGLRSVMVTSAQPGDGKTLTAVNLAIVLAESYRYNVLLVDADLRRPSIPHAAELTEGRGLSDVLRAQQDQRVALVPITARLTLLPAGSPTTNSIEALTSPRMRRILEEAGQRYDWVILDAPPVGPTADAHLLTQMVGGVLFVVRAGVTPSPAVESAIKSIGRDQILGVVLNGVTDMASSHYYYAAAPDTNA